MMSNRREFTRTVLVEIYRRASVNGVPQCERVENGVRCACTKGLEAHHIRMDAMETDKSRKLTADDGELLCGPHHDDITRMQQADLGKARAQEAAHLGANPKAAAPIVSRGFAKVTKRERPPLRVAAGTPEIARRFGGGQ